MPTINVRGSNKPASMAVPRGMPLVDAGRWEKALKDIEKNTKRLADLTGGSTPAVNGVRLPRETQQMERDLRRLIQLMERQSRAAAPFRYMGAPATRLGSAGANAAAAGYYLNIPTPPGGLPPFLGGRFGAGIPGRGGAGRPPAGAGGGGGGRWGGLAAAIGGPIARGFTAYELAKFAINPYNTIGGLEDRAISAARPYMNLRLGSFAAGRAGGFSGQSLQDFLYPGANRPMPGWMRALNMSGTDALQTLQGYGIAPRSAAQAQRMITSLGYYENISPGFAGMAPGSATAAAAQGAGLGITGGGASNYLGSIAAVLSAAVQQGMDRAKILASIQDTLGQIERSGALSISAGGNMDLFTRLMMSGAPGGRTGTLQAQTVGGIQGTLSNVLNNSPAMMAIYSAFQQNPPKSVNAVARMLGMSPSDMQAQMRSNPVFAGTVQNIISDYQQGRTGPAMAMMSQLLKQNPNAAATLFSGYVNRISGVNGPGEKGLALQSFGMPYAAGVAYSLPNKGLPSGGLNLSPQTYMSQFQTLQGTGSGGFMEGSNYRAELQKAGVPSQYIDDFITQGRRYNIDPLLLASIAQYESSMKPGALNTNRNGSIDYGLMQVNSGSTKLSASDLMNPSTNIAEGARIFAQKRAALAARGITDVGSVIGAYNPGAPALEQQGVSAAYGTYLQNAGVPLDVFGAAPSAEQMQMASSSVSFQEFAGHLVQVNDKFASLTGTTESLITAFNQLIGKLGAVNPGSPLTPGLNPAPQYTPPF